MLVLGAYTNLLNHPGQESFSTIRKCSCARPYEWFSAGGPIRTGSVSLRTTSETNSSTRLVCAPPATRIGDRTTASRRFRYHISRLRSDVADSSRGERLFGVDGKTPERA